MVSKRMLFRAFLVCVYTIVPLTMLILGEVNLSFMNEEMGTYDMLIYVLIGLILGCVNTEFIDVVVNVLGVIMVTALVFYEVFRRFEVGKKPLDVLTIMGFLSLIWINMDKMQEEESSRVPLMELKEPLMTCEVEKKTCMV